MPLSVTVLAERLLLPQMSGQNHRWRRKQHMIDTHVGALRVLRSSGLD